MSCVHEAQAENAFTVVGSEAITNALDSVSRFMKSCTMKISTSFMNSGILPVKGIVVVNLF